MAGNGANEGEIDRDAGEHIGDTKKFIGLISKFIGLISKYLLYIIARARDEFHALRPEMDGARPIF